MMDADPRCPDMVALSEELERKIKRDKEKEELRQIIREELKSERERAGS